MRASAGFGICDVVKNPYASDPYHSVLSPGAPAALWKKLLPAASALGRALLPERLAPRERCSRAAILFSGAPAFVYAVVDALQAMPELFPYARPAQELKQNQDDALDLRMLAYLLRELADLAEDAYLRRQHWALRGAREVVVRHRLEGRMPNPSEGQRLAHLRRSVQLFPALHFLPERARVRLGKPVEDI